MTAFDNLIHQAQQTGTLDVASGPDPFMGLNAPGQISFADGGASTAQANDFNLLNLTKMATPEEAQAEFNRLNAAQMAENITVMNEYDVFRYAPPAANDNAVTPAARTEPETTWANQEQCPECYETDAFARAQTRAGEEDMETDRNGQRVPASELRERFQQYLATVVAQTAQITAEVTGDKTDGASRGGVRFDALGRPVVEDEVAA